MENGLKNKRILVTAGPTWVAIDKVRVITNIFSGRTGTLIAKEAKKQGAKVKLLLGPGSFESPKNVNISRFYYFDQFYRLMQNELRQNKYDIVIHSAAISDYQPVKKYLKKIPSDKKNFFIKLKPCPKIIKIIKKLQPQTFLVQFKLEVGKTTKQLIDIAYRSMLKNNADLVVANDLTNLNTAYLIDSNKVITRVARRTELAKKLLRTLEQKL